MCDAVELNGRVRIMLFAAWEHAIDEWSLQTKEKSHRLSLRGRYETIFFERPFEKRLRAKTGSG